ncbi:hypothetical protein SB00610_01825 [Klebsiella quasipneumoniae subsp. similipneumoniae]|nr:hypothetical protein SB00610_01825 [Klebsiella quasipneumoniae subsp. similipneumoniae]
MAAADRVAGHHRYHRFRAGADLALKVEYVEMMHAGVVLIAAVIAADFLIAAGAKGFLTFPGQDNHPDIVVITGIRQCLDHFFDGQRAEGVAHLRAVDSNFGNAVGRFVVANIGIAFGTIVPFNRGIEHCFIKRDHRMSFS